MQDILPGEGLSLAEAANQRLRHWLQMEHFRELFDRTTRTASEVDPRIGPYVCISRQIGAGGNEISRELGRQLGWDVLDRELLDFMAERYHLSRALLENVDENTVNWITESLGPWIDQRIVTQQAYVQRLGVIVLLAAHRGRVIFVGRGIQFMLPREQGMSVAIIAPRKLRIERVRKVRHLSQAEAEALVDQTDEQRCSYLRRYFHHDPGDPQIYDLIINTEHCAAPTAVQMIALAIRGRGFTV